MIDLLFEMSSKKEIEKKLEEYRKNKKLSNNQSGMFIFVMFKPWFKLTWEGHEAIIDL